jgi:hypothetical protein
MPDTGSGQWPYPNSSATPDVPADILLLAQRNALMSEGWTSTANATTRAALVTNGDAFEGLRVYQIDTGVTYKYLSSAWEEWESGWITWATAPTGITVGTGGAASSLQRYMYVNGRCLFQYKFVLGSSGASVGTAPYLTLPFSLVPPSTRYATLPGDGTVYDSSGNTQNYTKARINDTTANQALISTYTGTYANITATAPFASWAAGDQLAGEFWGDPA